MSSKTQHLSEFDYEFNMPCKDFKKTIKKNLKVKIDYNTTETQNEIRGQSVGTYKFEKCWFIIQIPKYIREFIKGRFRTYTKDGIGNQGTYAEGTTMWEYQYNFKNFIKSEQFTDLAKQFNQIVTDALYIKQLEELEKNNKVIFVQTSYGNRIQVDDYNFGLRGNKLDLNFQFFVAYKVIKKNNFMPQYWQTSIKGTDDVIEYYAIEQRKSPIGNPNRGHKRLPLLTGYEIKNFTEIEWTQTREDFFADIEMKIAKVSMLITEFVKDIDADNIDLKIAENKKLLLLDTKASDDL